MSNTVVIVIFAALSAIQAGLFVYNIKQMNKLANTDYSDLMERIDMIEQDWNKQLDAINTRLKLLISIEKLKK
jgi:predicted lipoprotein